MLCPLGHQLKPVDSVTWRHATDKRDGIVPGSEMEWWAHVNDNEAHVLPDDGEGEVHWGNILAWEGE